VPRKSPGRIDIMTIINAACTWLRRNHDSVTFKFVLIDDRGYTTMIGAAPGGFLSFVSNRMHWNVGAACTHTNSAPSLLIDTSSTLKLF
jgi:hypothetical protein